MTEPDPPSLVPFFKDKIIITVSGAHSNVGKTLLAEYILSLVCNFSAIKVTINDLFTSVTADDASIMVPGKDTFRLKTAGAEQVVWVRSSEENLFESMKHALSLLASSAGILFEGSSALPYLPAHASFFVAGGAVEQLKQSRIYPLQNAAVIINNLREASDDAASIEQSLRQYNQHATIVSFNLKDRDIVIPFLKNVLKNLAGDIMLRGNSAY
jgi:hypothetical protein